MNSLLKWGTLALVLFVPVQVANGQYISVSESVNSIQTGSPASGYPELLFSLKEKFAIDNDRIVSTPELKKLSLQIDSVACADSVTAVSVKGYASIDGPVELNRNLASGRANAVAHWLTHSTKIDPSIITISHDGEDWNMFDSLVKSDPEMPLKADVLRIIASNNSVMAKQRALKALDGGSVWRYLAKNTLPEMRIAEVLLGGYHRYVLKVEEMQVTEVEETVMEAEESPAESVYETVPEIEPEYWTRNIYVKTNAPAWLMLWANAAFEIDLAPHWSFAVPVYYSGWNYFTSKLKFRTFSVVPEIRWWPRRDNMGFFLNGHLGLNQFNYAKGGDWRYQTYHGHSPALGGGIGIGYRWYFCKNHRWSMEAAVGAGVYHLDYSIFQNIPDGLIVGRRIRTFFGIDQAALSFVYSFGVQRKEVRK